MPHYITRQCPVCGTEYQADTSRLKHGRQTTCSRDCSYKLRARQSEVDPLIMSCQQCGKTFSGKPFAIKSHKYCSLACYNTFRGSPESLDRTCPVCGKTFHARNHRRIQCSRSCFEKAHQVRMKGAGNPAFIDGRSNGATYDAGASWKTIRLEVYRRDGFTCQRCGVKCVSKKSATPETNRRVIQCHHIIPYKQSRNNNLDNLITLCLRCHRRVHGKDGGLI